MMEGRIASGADSVPTNLAFVREGDYIRMIGMPMGRVIGRATVGRGIAGFRVRLVNGVESFIPESEAVIMGLGT